MKYGSAEYLRFWNKEVDRCKNGYKPSNGVWIPGSYYFYLNYASILSNKEGAGRKSLNHPDAQLKALEARAAKSQADYDAEGCY